MELPAAWWVCRGATTLSDLTTADRLRTRARHRLSDTVPYRDRKPSDSFQQRLDDLLPSNSDAGGRAGGGPERDAGAGVRIFERRAIPGTAALRPPSRDVGICGASSVLEASHALGTGSGYAGSDPVRAVLRTAHKRDLSRWACGRGSEPRWPCPPAVLRHELSTRNRRSPRTAATRGTAPTKGGLPHQARTRTSDGETGRTGTSISLDPRRAHEGLGPGNSKRLPSTAMRNCTTSQAGRTIHAGSPAEKTAPAVSRLLFPAAAAALGLHHDDTTLTETGPLPAAPRRPQLGFIGATAAFDGSEGVAATGYAPEPTCR